MCAALCKYNFIGKAYFENRIIWRECYTHYAHQLRPFTLGEAQLVCGAFYV